LDERVAAIPWNRADVLPGKTVAEARHFLENLPCRWALRGTHAGTRELRSDRAKFTAYRTPTFTERGSSFNANYLLVQKVV